MFRQWSRSFLFPVMATASMLGVGIPSALADDDEGNGVRHPKTAHGDGRRRRDTEQQDDGAFDGHRGEYTARWRSRAV